MPEMKPLTLWGCQSVAFIISFKVAPPDRFSRSRTLAVLLPWRAPDSGLARLATLASRVAFLAEVAFFAALPFAGATWGFRARVLAFLSGSDFSAVAGAVALA